MNTLAVLNARSTEGQRGSDCSGTAISCMFKGAERERRGTVQQAGSWLEHRVDTGSSALSPDLEYALGREVGAHEGHEHGGRVALRLTRQTILSRHHHQPLSQL